MTVLIPTILLILIFMENSTLKVRIFRSNSKHIIMLFIMILMVMLICRRWEEAQQQLQQDCYY